MATLTNEQIEQKKQLLAEKMKEANAIAKELQEAGALPLDEDDLDDVAGGIGSVPKAPAYQEKHWDRSKDAQGHSVILDLSDKGKYGF